MNYIDYIFLVFLAIGFILGFKDGFIRKLIGLAGFIIAIVVAFQFSADAATLLAPVIGGDLYLAEIVGAILIFLVIIFLVSVLKRVLHPTDKVNKFVNQLLGGIIGTVQMIFFISGFLLFLNLFQVPSKEARNNSLLFHSVSRVVPESINFIFGDQQRAREIIRDKIEQKDIEEMITE